jgi:MFS family permease
LLASVFAGGAIGAPLLGWFADWHGRHLAHGVRPGGLTRRPVE